jgi:acetyl-CoA carboxylase alpha subunit
MLEAHLRELRALSIDKVLEKRYQRLLDFGRFEDGK